MKKSLAIYFSAIFTFLSVYGIVYSCRAAVAQRIYYCAKFTPAGSEPRNLLNLCMSASQLYRHNYYFCALAAERAYYASFSMQGEAAGRNIVDAQHWCDTGLVLNPFRMQLRRLKACLLARNSLSSATKYWESCVDWQYWEPENHALLVELYALTGEYDKALDSLKLIKDSPCYAEASANLHRIWQKENELPSAMPGRVATPDRH